MTKKEFISLIACVMFCFNTFASSLPLNILLNICGNPNTQRITSLISNYGWSKDHGKFGYSQALGERWISTVDDMNMSVKTANNGSFMSLSYRFKSNSSAAERMAYTMPEYGFSLINKFKTSNGETHLVYTNSYYRGEFTIGNRDGIEYTVFTITRR